MKNMVANLCDSSLNSSIKDMQKAEEGQTSLNEEIFSVVLRMTTNHLTF